MMNFRAGSAFGLRVSDRTIQPARLLIKTLFPFALWLFAICLCGPSWSFTMDEPSPALGLNSSDKIPLTADSEIPADTDACLPLLRSIRYRNPVPVTQQGQPSGGEALVIGLVIGVRFALGPKEILKPRQRSAQLDAWHPSTVKNSEYPTDALAISAYRRCKNEQAVKALSGWRWAR